MTAGVAPARYHISPEEFVGLSDQILTEQPPTSDERYVCYWRSGKDEVSNLVRHIEREVFDETFGGHDEAKMRGIYGDHETNSDFIITMDQENQLAVGGLRIIWNSSKGLVTLRDVEKVLCLSPTAVMAYHGIDNPDQVLDIGTVVVPEPYRQIEDHLISNMLYRGMHLLALSKGIKHYVSIIGPGARSTFDFVGIPFQPLAGTEPFTYEEAKDSQAMYGDATDFIAGVERRYASAEAHEKSGLAVYTGRLAAGTDIDHRLMFDF